MGRPWAGAVGDETLMGKGALDAATRDDFRAAGLLHLLVVSGSQVAALILKRHLTWQPQPQNNNYS